MRAGFTFFFVRGAPGERTKRHLWAIISDPQIDPARILAVNFTSWQPVHEQTLVLDAGEHRFITRRTCVNYQQAQVFTLAQLQAWEQDGLIERDENLSPELLRRIRNAASESRRLRRECYAILEDQDLIDYDDLD